MKKFNLKTKNALITGGAGLLGREHAIALLELGCSVVLTDINLEALLEVRDKISKENSGYSGRLIAKELDVTNLVKVKKLEEELYNDGFAIDILINNAAIDPKVKIGTGLEELSRFENFDIKQWEVEISVGLTGALHCSQVFGKRMAEKKSGVIVNIASDLGVFAPDQRIYRKEGLPEDNQPVKPVTYSVIKHGLVGLTKYLATYWADKGVRCNALSPGGVFNGQDDAFVSRLTNLIPMGRMASKDEYRGAIQFLSSDASAYMNGQNLVLDGGRSVW